MNIKQYSVALGPLLLYAIFPLTFSFGKAATLQSSASLFVALRMVFSGVCLLSIAIFYNQFRWPDKNDLPLFLGASLLGIYGTYLPEFWAIKYLTVAKSTFLFVLAPFFTALFSYIKGIETFSYKKVLGLFIGLIGFLPLIIFSCDQELAPAFFYFNLPELATIFAVGSYAYSWIFVKELVYKKNYSAPLVHGFSMLFSGILACITALILKDFGIITQLPLSFFTNVFYASCIGMFCYWLYAILLAYFSPTYLSFFGLIEPFFAALYGWIFFAETISWHFLIGSIIVTSGLYLYYQEELQAPSLTLKREEI